MAKLIFTTKPPRKGYCDHESFMTHDSTRSSDKFPTSEVQKEAHEIVLNTMHDLIKKLDALGYDQTKVRFSIHYKSI
jgi:hypothetical protein